MLAWFARIRPTLIRIRRIAEIVMFFVGIGFCVYAYATYKTGDEICAVKQCIPIGTGMIDTPIPSAVVGSDRRGR